MVILTSWIGQTGCLGSLPRFPGFLMGTSSGCSGGTYSKALSDIQFLLPLSCPTTSQLSSSIWTNPATGAQAFPKRWGDVAADHWVLGKLCCYGLHPNLHHQIHHNCAFWHHHHLHHCISQFRYFDHDGHNFMNYHDDYNLSFSGRSNTTRKWCLLGGGGLIINSMCLLSWSQLEEEGREYFEMAEGRGKMVRSQDWQRRADIWKEALGD